MLAPRPSKAPRLAAVEILDRMSRPLARQNNAGSERRYDCCSARPIGGWRCLGRPSTSEPSRARPQPTESQTILTVTSRYRPTLATNLKSRDDAPTCNPYDPGTIRQPLSDASQMETSLRLSAKVIVPLSPGCSTLVGSNARRTSGGSNASGGYAR